MIFIDPSQFIARCSRGATRFAFAAAIVASTSCARDAASGHDSPQALERQTVVAQSGTRLELEDGPVRGSTDDHTRSFIGIPYAAPPVGALRWRPPEQGGTWTDTLDATGPGVACIQPDSSLVQSMVQSEDCLQLNVFAPAELPETPVPVMVWIHGGANNTGSANAIVHKPALYGDDASSRLYDGAVFRELAEREVVVVTVNYRLGVLGFMSHRGLTTEQRASGNYGLMDQRAALHWVQRNIAAFGGDAERVTLFGQSGGATDVCYHLVSDDSRGLFQAAVLESGSCGPVRLPELAEAEQQGKELAAELGCAQTNPADSLSCLRAKPAPEFARPTPRDQLVSRELSGLAVIDGHVLREQPETSLAAGHFARVPLVVGTDDHDGSYLFSQASSQALELVDADPSAAESTDVSGEYPAIIDGLTSAAISDAYFTCPARRLAARMSQDAPVFLYRFRRSAAYEPSIQPFESRDVAHGVDQLWLWNVWPALSPYANDDVQLSLQMRSYFMQLIDGDVNTDAPQRWTRPQWPKFEREHPAQLVFDLEITSSEARRDGDCEAFD